MKTHQIQYQFHDTADSLAEDEQKLLKAAGEASKLAYAPYSHFHVGCALLLEKGDIITGNNQENLAYPSGLCAERVAFFQAGAQGVAGEIRKVAIKGYSTQKEVTKPITPCGACRQVMLEYEREVEHPFVFIMQGKSGKILRLEGIAASLLPFSFDVDF